MKPVDILLLLIIVCIVYGALRLASGRKKNGSSCCGSACPSCDGKCIGCGRCGK